MGKKYNIKTFMEEFCQDIIKDKDILELTSNENDFSYDVIRKDSETGEDIKYVVAEDGTEIPIFDILEMPIEDFTYIYKTKEALDMYKQYIANFTIDYGEDVLFSLRNKMIEQNNRIQRYRRLLE